MSITNLKMFCRHNILTTSEVAEKLQVSRQRINTLVKTGELQPIKQTPHVSLFFLADVEDYLKRKGRRLFIPNISPPFLYEKSGTTSYSVNFFYENKHLLGDIRAVFAYFTDIDAALDNFFLPSDAYRYGSLYHLEVPGLVLRDERGYEMWLNGCNCGYGGTGPNGTKTILKECGFSDEHINNVFCYRIVKLFKDENGNIEVYTRDSPFDRGCDYDIGHANLYLYKDHLVLIQNKNFRRIDHSKTLERYMAFLPNPTEFLIFPTWQMAKEHGYVVPYLHGEEIYNIIIQDVKGNQIWLNTYVDNSEPLASQKNLIDLLYHAGFEIPKEEKNVKLFSLFKTWFNSNLRRVPVEPITFSKNMKK